MNPDEMGILQHLYAIYLTDINFAALTTPGSLLLWLLILMPSLKKIDCSHFTTGMAYVTFCTACGIFLVIALPETFYGIASDVRSNFLLIGAMVALSTLRWAKTLVWQTNLASQPKSKQKEGLNAQQEKSKR